MRPDELLTAYTPHITARLQTGFTPHSLHLIFHVAHAALAVNGITYRHGFFPTHIVIETQQLDPTKPPQPITIPFGDTILNEPNRIETRDLDPILTNAYQAVLESIGLPTSDLNAAINHQPNRSNDQHLVTLECTDNKRDLPFLYTIPGHTASRHIIDAWTTP